MVQGSGLKLGMVTLKFALYPLNVVAKSSRKSLSATLLRREELDVGSRHFAKADNTLVPELEKGLPSVDPTHTVVAGCSAR